VEPRRAAGRGGGRRETGAGSGRERRGSQVGRGRGVWPRGALRGKVVGRGRRWLAREREGVSVSTTASSWNGSERGSTRGGTEAVPAVQSRLKADRAALCH
jgi:hypothetical protein